MKHSNLTVSLTHYETRNGLAYMAISLIALPWLLSEGNAFLADPLSQGKVNFVYYLINFLVMIWLCRKFLTQSLNYALKIPFPVLWYGILGYLGAQALGEVLGILTLFVYPSFSNVNDETIISMLREDSQLIIWGTVFLVPLVEELFFRGLIFRNLWNKNHVTAYLVSMALFSLIHVAGYIGAYSPVHLLLCFLQYLPAAFCLCWCYCQTGTIITPIIMHALTNAMSVYYLLR